MRKIILSVYIVLGLIIVVILASFLFDKEVKNQIEETQMTEKSIVEIEDFEEKITKDERIIDKKTAIRLLCLARENKVSIEVSEPELSAEIIDTNEWYYKYFNVAFIENWLDFNSPINVDSALKYKEFVHIIDCLNIKNVSVSENYFNESDVLYDDFKVLFNKVLETYQEASSPIVRELYVFKVEEEYIITDWGKYYYEGESYLEAIDHKVSVLVRGNDILLTSDAFLEDTVLNNVYIEGIDKENNQVTLFIGGGKRVIDVDQSIELDKLTKGVSDVKIINNEVIMMEQHRDITKGIVKKITNELVALEGGVQLIINKNCKIYDISQGMVFTSIYDVLVGYNTNDFYINENNEVIAIVINEIPSIQHIRVAINNTNYTSLFHEKVSVISEGALTVTYNEDHRLINENTAFDMASLTIEEGDRVILQSDSPIKLLTVKRGWGNKFNPTYKGKLEVEKTKTGYVIVNEVDFETYLYGVVPSEMPVNHGLEALKVQAICARSYAYNQFYSNTFCRYGAHVDDSTMSQVYNNVRESSLANQGVNETKGMLLSYGGNVVSANFFSTSCGITSNVGEVWANYRTKVFPTTTVEYLSSRYQGEESLNYDLTNEEEFKNFIDDSGLDTYDSAYSWYRWHVKMNKEQIKNAINVSIEGRYKVNPLLIKTMQEDGQYRSRPISEIAEIKDIHINSRGDSGIITSIVIETIDHSYLISTEYNIRKLLAPVDYDNGKITITRKDGSVVNNMSILPSAYFYIEKSYDEAGIISHIKLIGGGYGHGVGMSQNGVKTMVDKGYNYEEILKHYYKGSEVIIK